MPEFNLAEETLGYVTNEDASNTDKRLLVSGSQNVMIDAQKKVKIRSGYERLGVANVSRTKVRNAWAWQTSTGSKLPQRFYDDELEVYIGTLDGYEINAWKRVASGWSTTNMLRSTTQESGGGGWFDTTEDLDLQVMVNGDDNTYAWNGAVAVVASVTANTITKAGTTTFAQNRFYADAGSTRTLINVRTGTEFSYTGGEDTTTLTGVTGSPVTDAMVAGDVLVQKIVTNTDSPAAGRNNDTVYMFQNQLIVGSDDANEVYVSKNTDYTDFALSSPRVPGEGALLTLDAPAKGLVSLGSDLLISAGRSIWYKMVYRQLDVGGTLTETLEVEKLSTGVEMGTLNQECIVPLGNEFAFLSHEVACRVIASSDDLSGISNKPYSTPIKPDFDAEVWYNSSNVAEAFGTWYKTMLLFSAPQGSHLYILNFVEDAKGKLQRFWNPPQILPVGPMSIIDLDDGDGPRLYGHSNGIPESYLLFEGASDLVYDGMAVKDKLPINAKAVYAYNNYNRKGELKNFDEYYVEGEITQNTNDLLMTLDYDYDGQTQSIEKTIDGSDEDILEGAIGFNSLAQQSLGLNPLGSLLNPPTDARRFRAIYEQAKEDFFELRVTFSTNEVDRYWSIIAHGGNVELSRRKPIDIKT